MKELDDRTNGRDESTFEVLKELAVKIKTGEFDHIVDIKLPPIRTSEQGIILPKFESLKD